MAGQGRMDGPMMTLRQHLLKSSILGAHVVVNRWAWLRLAMGQVATANGSTHQSWPVERSVEYIGRVFREYLACSSLTPEGKPAGLWMYSGFLQEPALLGFAYDLEQEIHPRSQPEFLGMVPAEPPDAGICPAPLHPQPGIRQLPYHFGTGKRFKHLAI